jgi:hypothetical protein
MNRRKFLGLLGIAPLAVKYAPLLSKLAPAPTAYSTYICGSAAMIGEYNDYANFSSFATVSAIDDCVAKAAEELGYQAGQTMRFQYNAVFDN